MRASRLVLALVLISGTAVLAADPYIRKGTWDQTLFATRQAAASAAAQQDPKAQPKGFVSPLVHGGDEPIAVRVDIRGWKDLFLIVDEAGDYHNDVANWGDARLVSDYGREFPLEGLEPASAKQQWGKFRRDNRNAVGGPIAVGSKKYEHGIGTHARSVIHYRLDGNYNWFLADAGIEPARKTATVKFIVSPTDVAARTMDPDGALWDRLARDFPDEQSLKEMAREKADGIWRGACRDIAELAGRYAKATRAPLATAAPALLKAAKEENTLKAVRALYHRSRDVEEAAGELAKFDPEALRLAIEDLARTFGEKYPRGAEFLAQLENLRKAPAREPGDVLRAAGELKKLQRDALLANPLLDFDKLLLVLRSEKDLGLPANWQSNSSLHRGGFENEIAMLSPVAPGGKISTLYRPSKPVFIGDVDLHFDAGRMLFSSVDENNRWQVFEMNTDATGLRAITGEQPDVDSYDACYLPDERIIFSSTAPFVGVPCVNGSSHVTNLYIASREGKNIRQLTVDQEHNWCPQVLNNGRILYLRWEYTDTPHSNTRLLFHMNPDGTNQSEYYGSNSYWPNGVFYARPIPNHPTKVIGIVTGHHGVKRMGELVLFDPARSSFAADGVVQRIPGRGKKVEPVFKDALVNESWPKFLHPFPLSDKYFLVSAKPTPQSAWGIYLVDVFDNMLLLAEMPGQALLEPVPLRKTARPPVIQDRVDLSRKDAVVTINDVYRGDSMRGIPRGTVKSLRVYSYHYSYQGMGGLLGVIGMDGPWDVRRILGTVPVRGDGSVSFTVPAYTPVAVQPLDESGRAMQVMRSWFTAMPGENLTCAGCHEKQNTSPPALQRQPQAQAPAAIQPWYGPTRGFSYAREVQPVIDRYCIGCHDGKPLADGATPPNLRGDEQLKDFEMVTPGHGYKNAGLFSVGYANLHRYVRHAGIESDYHVLMPGEFHPDTTHLVQMLMKGHYGVQLDAQAWDRINTWIDLNTPYHGTWHEELAKCDGQRERRRELRKLYTGIDEDPEEVIDTKYNPGPFAMPAAPREKIEKVEAAGWPMSAEEAARRQVASGGPITQSVDVGGGMKLEMMLIPAGQFVMGDANGYPDERPLTRVRIEKPFWVGKFEVTNAQYAQFDPRHDSHVESKQAYQFGVHGYPVDGADQPVVRVSWERAMAFCRWLSQRTGRNFTLPTEAQWEYACRAGSNTPLSYGDLNADFSRFANLADAKLSEFASDPYTIDRVLKDRTPYDDYVPKDTRYNDGGLVTVNVGKYKANAWGLHDMHGNAAEWTRTTYKAYPYDSADGRDGGDAAGRKVVRGGSWRDRPRDCRSANRLSYPYYRGVYNVGFRVVCEAAADGKVAAR